VIKGARFAKLGGKGGGVKDSCIRKECGGKFATGIVQKEGKDAALLKATGVRVGKGGRRNLELNSQLNNSRKEGWGARVFVQGNHAE